MSEASTTVDALKSLKSQRFTPRMNLDFVAASLDFVAADFGFVVIGLDFVAASLDFHFPRPA
jgi:hypothetical protein